MSSSLVLETSIAVSMFLGYVVLWQLKRRRDIRATGVDPEVLDRAITPLQSWFSRMVWVMTALVGAILLLHAAAPPTWPPLVRAPALEGLGFDLLGGALGLGGLALCARAQALMGSSWRVGIDTDCPTALVTHGIYARIRNPTCLGMHLVSAGLWVVWPTALVAGYAILLFVVMDMQVRAEEEHLISVHGEAYLRYAAATHRYLPGIY